MEAPAKEAVKEKRNCAFRENAQIQWRIECKISWWNQISKKMLLKEGFRIIKKGKRILVDNYQNALLITV